ncbi:meiotic nuclear division protein 1, putative [Plasmodium knowlesi strain H]|uniref:Meiotic nuclear division protein 1, putative n=2 Tax=Plasmodium knowlesi TaxID=5850 RepID=A0A679L635_PLAKH|nr:meiotic nuclear division protein 1, putative [Plasmodium knowlesi strain H]OTN65460.1 putative Meiotic nuclear division protein 1 [Plasmodium knowlesi]CAA9989530.1 meiotic nuclear division protein 1, putative [Plasmodium knowlesi strain H]VVS79004.1 meiotic nuclear division protein 1, putative [Plasmodium knowlesi strain H]
MKKKGKSNDEKKQILYDIMLESESFFILKELEALAPKKGIRSLFVKDLLQQLVDDNKVKSEKVGLQNVYWVLKTEESSTLQNSYQEMKEKKEEYEENAKREKEDYEEFINSLSISQEQLKDKLEKAQTLMNHLDDKKKKLENVKKTDIKHIEMMKMQNECAVESIQRWNNNISLVKQWIQDRTNKPSDTVDRLLGIKDIFNNWN